MSEPRPGQPTSGVYAVVAVLVAGVLLGALVLVGSLYLSDQRQEEGRPLAPASPTATPLG